ncbi:MAG: antibiotic biosynthesis monooxygenase family protein [Pseudomonadota bacterium]
MNKPLCIVATITPLPEHLDDARNAIIGIVPQTLQESGCQMFRLLEGDDGCLRLYEEWDDEAALQAH